MQAGVIADRRAAVADGARDRSRHSYLLARGARIDPQAHDTSRWLEPLTLIRAARRSVEPAAPRFADGVGSRSSTRSRRLMLAYPALAGAFLVNPISDQYKAGYAFRDFAAQSLRAGHGFPQWNPFL